MVIDASGARGEAEHLRAKLMGLVYPMLVYITDGNEITPAQGGGYNVPKSYIKGMIPNVLGDERISAADDLPAGDILRRELAAFRVKITKAANEIYEANEGEHDDLVIAIGFCLLSTALPALGWTAAGRLRTIAPAKSTAVWDRGPCSLPH